MALTTLLAFVALAAVTRAAPATGTATCADGTTVGNEACCAFIPVSSFSVTANAINNNFRRYVACSGPAKHVVHGRLWRGWSVIHLTTFCAEAHPAVCLAHESIRLIFRKY